MSLHMINNYFATNHGDPANEPSTSKMVAPPTPNVKTEVESSDNSDGDLGIADDIGWDSDGTDNLASDDVIQLKS